MMNGAAPDARLISRELVPDGRQPVTCTKYKILFSSLVCVQLCAAQDMLTVCAQSLGCLVNLLPCLSRLSKTATMLAAWRGGVTAAGGAACT
jgi:hypothetical protein